MIKLLIFIPILIIIGIASIAVLLFMERLLHWASLVSSYQKYGYLNIYKLFHSNKSADDYQLSGEMYGNVIYSFKHNKVNSEEHKDLVLAKLLDSASLSMRSHNLYIAKETLTFIKENKEFFKGMTLSSKSKKVLQKKWYCVRHYCWMLDEWKEVDFLKDLLFDYKKGYWVKCQIITSPKQNKK